MQKLIYFVGVAGTGKTTVAAKVARDIPCAFLDRDTVGGRFVERFLESQGLDPEDRDSDYYKENLRDLEYDTTKDICIENLRMGQNVFMISPFTSELKNKNYLEKLLKKARRSKKEVDVKVTVVALNDIEEQRKRIERRGPVRENWKLENWDQYEERVNFVPEINWDIPEENILIFDNSGPLTKKKIRQLTDFVSKNS